MEFEQLPNSNETDRSAIRVILFNMGYVHEWIMTKLEWHITGVIRGASFDYFRGSALESVAVDHVIFIRLWR